MYVHAETARDDLPQKGLEEDSAKSRPSCPLVDPRTTFSWWADLTWAIRIHNHREMPTCTDNQRELTVQALSGPSVASVVFNTHKIKSKNLKSCGWRYITPESSITCPNGMLVLSLLQAGKSKPSAGNCVDKTGLTSTWLGRFLSKLPPGQKCIHYFLSWRFNSGSLCRSLDYSRIFFFFFFF